MRRMMRSFGRFLQEEWGMLLLMGVLLSALAGCVWWGLYESHFKQQWAEQARVAKLTAERNAREEAAKKAILAEARECAAGNLPLDKLSKDAQDMINEALCRLHPDWRGTEKFRKDVYPELYEIVPGLVPPGLSFDNEPTPSVEEFQQRRNAFCEKHKAIYTPKRDRSELSHEEYLRIDRKELFWITIMGNRLNDRSLAQAKEVSTRVPVVKDAILAARLVHCYGSGQHCYAANSAVDVYGMTKFSDALLEVLVSGGHNYFVPNGKYGNGILMPPDKPKDGVHSWSAAYNPRTTGRHLSFRAYSVEPTTLSDLTGRVIAIQVGKEALRVTFFDEKGSPEKLTQAALRLAEILGVKPQKKDAHAQWMRVDGTTTWELKLGA